MKQTGKWWLVGMLATSVCLAEPASQGTEQEARRKMVALNQLIDQADEAGIDVLREKMTVRTAETFLNYADWDEAHQETNVSYFEQASKYKKDAVKMAEELADFERADVVRMLDQSQSDLKDLLAGRTRRLPTPKVDWAEVVHEGDQLTYQGRPVFLTDWTWKPDTPELTEFHGQQDGFFLMHPYVMNEQGDIHPRVKLALEDKADGKLGFIFLNHKGTPKWAREKYGPNFVMREDTYTAYDIDSPGAREVNRLLLAGTVPYMAGKKYSELGYMLCNEPHFYTTKEKDTDDPKKWGWACGSASEYTVAKFRTWLSQRHESIGELNELWGTEFADFDAVQIEVPIYKGLQGTPKWYDWVTFNMDRVTDWFQFLKSEIRKHDPDAKVHLKVMPNLWTENARGHGLDMEALTRMSGIIGNDCGSAYNHMWKKPEWMDHYVFEWRELCMSHDFFKSVSPEKIMYNTESHFLSTGSSRDLNMDPAYARATFWLAHTQGLTVSQNWFWTRKADGSIPKKAGNGYAGSNNQQPRIVNEVHATMMDLNACSEEIMAMQRQKKPIRIFYSKASAVNKPEHMDDVFELYESLHFEGLPLGFVTCDILKTQDPENWDVVLVHKTEFVTAADLAALQEYVDRGGKVIVDGVSLAKDEYGRPIRGLKGPVRRTDSLEKMKSAALRMVASKGDLPPVKITEKNSTDNKGCTWKCITNSVGNPVLSIVNLGKTDATLDVQWAKGKDPLVCTDILTGRKLDGPLTAKPYEVVFVEVTR